MRISITATFAGFTEDFGGRNGLHFRCVIESDSDELFEHLQRDDGAGSLFRVDGVAKARQDSLSLTVLFVFIAQATKQSTAQSGDLTWVQAEVLILGHAHVYVWIERQPGGAAQGSAALA